MSNQLTDSISVEELASTPMNPDMVSVWAEGVNPQTGYEYGYVFVFDHPNGSYIKIDSEKREAFLEKGTEEEAQVAIIGIAQATRRISGGEIGIHPYHGAVWGTKLTPIVPVFMTDLEEPNDELTMFVNMNPDIRSRVQAATEGLQEEWIAQFKEFNTQVLPGGGLYPEPMEMTPANIASLLSALEEQGELTEIKVTAIHK